MVKVQAGSLLGALLILGTAEKDQRCRYHVFTDLSSLTDTFEEEFLIGLLYIQ